jgi:putative transposase
MSTLIQNYQHIVFSTKYRQPFIDENIEYRLFTYIKTVCEDLECPVKTVGGYLDHIHICCNLSKKIPLMTLVQKIKANSSRWIKQQGEQYQFFQWQKGYASFSVGYKELSTVCYYILNQRKHHQTNNYKTELCTLLDTYELDYDERYLWEESVSLYQSF